MRLLDRLRPGKRWQPLATQPDASRSLASTAGRTQWWTGDPRRLTLLSPADHCPSLVRHRNLLSPEQCRLLIECFERQRPVNAARTGSEYWDGRYIWQNSLPPAEVDALRVMQQVRLLAQLAVCREFRPAQALYSDTAQLVFWPKGMELTPHADNLNPDGQPNATPHRCYSSLLYLNDDYEGGETYFPGIGVRVKPETGLMLIFGSGADYVHGVSKVTSGSRYTYAGWFTFDPAREDPNARLVF
ncbi:prolyl hydroxylase family protein [Mesorhizobium comanense]|uniref:prolyl hydroxylase family protein n=1 Tax=Mesorhizobium comanense TaxID=2502215 RepID=UPI00148561A8|nr:2OG-Fe(II) oxygenase [Mesorhizobium comanense]